MARVTSRQFRPASTRQTTATSSSSPTGRLSGREIGTWICGVRALPSFLKVVIRPFCVIDCGGTQADRHGGFIFRSGESSGSRLESIGIVPRFRIRRRHSLRERFKPDTRRLCGQRMSNQLGARGQPLLHEQILAKRDWLHLSRQYRLLGRRGFHPLGIALLSSRSACLRTTWPGEVEALGRKRL